MLDTWTSKRGDACARKGRLATLTSQLLAAALALATASACYHYRVMPANSAPADDGHSTTKHALFWGLYQEQAEQPNCQGNGIAEVVATTNFGYVLLSAATLGIWVPITLEWKCAKDRLKPETWLE